MKKILVLMFLLATTLFANFTQDEGLLMGELDNGLRYFIYPNNRPNNFISVRLRVDAGSLFEKEGEEGLAHFLEHMAFNGTEKYAENDLIRVLESMGVAFGPDLNAYTSFEETVYMLDGEKKYLEKFLDIMHQWAFKMTLDPIEIEKEKGVVIEEWRQLTGLTKELNDFYQSYLFNNSMYLERLPIGLVPSIQSFNQEMLKDFYERWYVPNNMSLFIAGSIEDSHKVEELIKQYFANEKAKDLEDIEHLKYREIEAIEDIDTFINSQLRSNTLSFLQIVDSLEFDDQLDSLRYDVVSMLFNIAFNNRYSEKLNSLDSNLNSISLSHHNFNDYFAFQEFSLSLKDGRELEGIIEGFAELNQLYEGFYEEEIYEAIEIARVHIANMLESVDNLETGNIISRMMDFDFDNDIFLSKRDDILLTLEILDDIEAYEVNLYLEDLLQGIEAYFLYAGYKELPIEDIIDAIVTGLATDIGSYVLEDSEGEIITKEIKKGSIIEEVYNSDKDYYILTLSNGSKVYVKDTKYSVNDVEFLAISRGGLDYIATEDLVTMEFIHSVISSGPGSMTRREYERYTQGQNFFLNYGIDKDTQFFYGGSSTRQIGELMANFYAFVTEAKLDETQLLIDKSRSIESVINRDNVKANEFWRLFRQVLDDYDDRKRWLDADEIEKVEGPRLLELYNKTFANGINYDYYIVGDINYDDVKLAIEYYLASLTEGERLDYKPIKDGMLDRNVVLERNLAHGEEATVILYFGDRSPIDQNYRYYSQMATSVLDSELIKVVREELGGAYSISSWTEISKHDLNRGRMALAFTCDPNRVDELVKASKKVIENVLNGGITDESISFIKETYRRDYERLLGTNDFYTDYFERLILGEEKPLTPEEFNKLVSKDSIIDFINSIYGGYIGRFVLYPEI